MAFNFFGQNNFNKHLHNAYLATRTRVRNTSLNKSRWNKNYLLGMLDCHLIHYPTPVSLTYAWSFGSLAGISLVIQIISGVLLSMHYSAHIDLAFQSVEYIMRDVPNGWLIRYVHANGASMFFIVVYAHLFRGLYYGSYMKPRQMLWCSGVVLLLLLMGTAFTGYVLPWGQMSFWGATVITNMVTALPGGQIIVEWLWGGYTVNAPTLRRFYSIHFALPFIIAAMTLVHLALLHKVGSTSPIGSDTGVDDVPFYPYYAAKDLFALMCFLFVFGILVFFFPNYLNHPDNCIPADPMETPKHLVPEWYFLPFYAILRSIPHKGGGIVAMIGAILVLFLIPFTYTGYIRNTTYRPLFKVFYWLLVSDCMTLMWVGQAPITDPFIELGQIASIYYFSFFTFLFPIIGIIETKLAKYDLTKNEDSVFVKICGDYYNNGFESRLNTMIKQELFEMYHLKEMSLSAEFFLSCSILQLTFYAISTAYNRKAGFVMLNQPIYYIGSLLLGLTILLLLNEDLLINNYYISNNSIVNDYLSFIAKLTVCLISLLFLIIINISFRDNPIRNNFEYVVLLSISVLGLLLLCSSNDLITAYLAIELQSVAFYIMAAFKKNSTYSIESGLKYFIIGSLSSAFFLFGSAILYGCLGSLNFDDFRMFSSIIFPSSLSESTEFSFENLATLAAIFKLLNLDLDIRADIIINFSDALTLNDNWVTILLNSVLEDFSSKGFHRAFYDVNYAVTHTRFFFDTLDRPSILLDNINENDFINVSTIFPYDLLKDIETPSYPAIMPLNDILSVDLQIPFWVSHQHPWLCIIPTFWPTPSHQACDCVTENRDASELLCFITYTDMMYKCLDIQPNHNLLNYYNFNVEMLTIEECINNFDILNSEPNYFLLKKIYSSYSQTISSSLNDVSDSFILDTDFISIGFLLICISLLIKLAVAPFHYWSLDVYEGSPNTTTVFFAVIPKIGLFVLLVRICYSCFYSIFINNYQIYFILFSVFSIFVGSLGGLEQRKIKTLFAYSSISHTGYLLLSFSTGSVEGTQMMFYYLVIYMISSLCFWAVYLFLIQKKTFYLNKNNKELGDFVLLKESNPMLSLILALTLFSIAGIPPVVGFLAKIGIFLVVVKSYAYLVAVTSVLLSVISTFYYIRFIKILYFDNSLVGKLYFPISTTKSLIIALLAVSLVILCIDPMLIYLVFYKASLLSNY